MLQARLASFLQWSKSSLSLFFFPQKKGVTICSFPWKQHFLLCLCMHVCKVLKYQLLPSAKRRSPSLLHNLLSQVPPKIELFLSVSLIVVFTPVPASECIFYEIIELVHRSKLHFWLTLTQTIGMCIKYEYHWKEYTADPKLTFCRVAHPDRFAFIFHIGINLIEDPYCRLAACFVWR